MSYTQENPQAASTDSPSLGDSPATSADARVGSPLPRSEADHPRIVEEHHTAGPDGQDEIEATDDRGRQWYHVRPEPRGRADMMGFNYTWWLFFILVVVVLILPW